MDIFTRRLAMGAAGAAGSDKTYVNDVYQSHLYDGGNGNRSIPNGIKLGTAGLGYGVQFDGHTDYLSLASNSDFNFGTGDFTIEFWALSDSYSGSPYFCDFRDDGGNTGTTNRIVWYTSSSDGKPRFWLNGSARITATNATTNGSWAHYALVRSSGTTTMYIGGVSQGTYSDSTNYGDAPLTIGQRKGSYASQSYDGKISDFRIVKGTAVYTSAFSPPTKALENIANTKLLCCNQKSVTGYTVSPVPITPSTTDEDLMSSSGPFTLSADEVKGGLVWIKNRKNSGYGHFLFDTNRGIQNAMCTNLTNAQFFEGNGVKAFNADGFDLGDDAAFNTDGQFYQSYTFAKSAAFFDIVTYTGNASAWNSGSQTLNHNLGCIPGLIIVKSLTQGSGPPDRNWYVYHKDIPNKPLYLDLNASHGTGSGAPNYDPRYFNDPLNNPPTATTFQVGDNVSGGGSYGGPPGFGANENGQSYLAYLFAGGASDQTGSARSVEFDGSDYLQIASSSDLSSGTGDFTFEAWVKSNGGTSGSSQCIYDNRSGTGSNTTGFFLGRMSAHSGKVELYSAGGYRCESRHILTEGQWNHVAVVRQSNVIKLYLNGTLSGDVYNVTDNYSNTTARIGIGAGGSDAWQGKISNVRFVKGTAVYTASFIPSNKGLSDITNTKLLCCNKNTVTGSTITPSTITSNGNPQSSTDTPFDDLEGFKFGEGGDQNIVKCGEYYGNGSTNGPEVYLGWEPQWLLIKRVNSAEDWYLVDPIRTSERDGMYLDEFRPNNANAEGDGAGNDSEPYLNFTATGFKCLSNSGMTNSQNDHFIYIAIRREDGYVGKPATIGSEFFTPTYDKPGAPLWDSSGHVVDYTLQKSNYQSGTADWSSVARLVSNERLETNQSLAEQFNTYQSSDFQAGWSSYTGGDGSRFAYLFKRHAGMDVVEYKGDGRRPRDIPHSLGKPPEMIWTKGRDSAYDWRVWHMGLNGGGANATTWNVILNSTGAQSSNGDIFSGPNNILPTSTHYTVGGNAGINESGTRQIAMLFATTDVSKVGFWVGDGTYNRQITTGFQPRVILVFLTNQGAGYDWQIMDSVRGFIGPNNNILKINTTASQSSQGTYFTPTATGFTITESAFNGSNQNWIYYAHA